jgi:hypothetical protein
MDNVTEAAAKAPIKEIVIILRRKLTICPSMIGFSCFQYSVYLLQKTEGRAEFNGQLKKREPASGPVEWERDNE